MNNHRSRITLRGLASLLCWLVFVGCSENGTNARESSAPAPMAQIAGEKDLPAEFQDGETKFITFCSPCHGVQGT
ncbi:MAG: hypothetical protein CO149_02720, partial [Nitrospirae bacterium CG_4_9_14_3_um_filter_51_5]